MLLPAASRAAAAVAAAVANLIHRFDGKGCSTGKVVAWEKVLDEKSKSIRERS